MERGLERAVIRSCDVLLCVAFVSLGMYCVTVSLADSVLVLWRFPPLPVCKVKKVIYKTALKMWRNTHTNVSFKETNMLYDNEL